MCLHPSADREFVRNCRIKRIEILSRSPCAKPCACPNVFSATDNVLITQMLLITPHAPADRLPVLHPTCVGFSDNRIEAWPIPRLEDNMNCSPGSKQKHSSND